VTPILLEANISEKAGDNGLGDNGAPNGNGHQVQKFAKFAKF